MLTKNLAVVVIGVLSSDAKIRVNIPLLNCDLAFAFNIIAEKNSTHTTTTTTICRSYSLKVGL